MSTASQPPSNTDSIAGFDRTIPLAVEALEHRARDVESVAGAGDEAAVVKAYAAARFFIVQTDVDMRVLLRAMAADPAARVTTEKLLALVLRESIEGVYRVLGDLQRTARTQTGASPTSSTSTPSPQPRTPTKRASETSRTIARSRTRS